MSDVISIVHGDSVRLRAEILLRGSGDRYIPAGNDIICMDIKKDAYQEVPDLSKSAAAEDCIDGFAEFYLSADDTRGLDIGDHFFDIRIAGETVGVHTVTPVHCLRIVRCITDIPAPAAFSADGDPARITVPAYIGDDDVCGCGGYTEKVPDHSSGAGNGGVYVTDYRELSGKPSINGVTLTGSMTSEELRINIPSEERISEIALSVLDSYQPEDITARESLAAHAADRANPHGVTLAQAGGVGENLLINPDFRVNQRGVSGTVTAAGYFVDRWYLKSGSVTVSSSGSLILNGTIIQILENAAGDNVTASASAGQASYDDSTRTFTLTGSSVAVSWAKLEYGRSATPFTRPNLTEEKLRCMRFFQRHGRAYGDGAYAERILYCNARTAGAAMHFPAAMRTAPTWTINGAPFTARGFTTSGTNFPLSDQSHSISVVNENEYVLQITSDSITAGSVDGSIGYYIPQKGNYIDFDAEIYPQEV